MKQKRNPEEYRKYTERERVAQGHMDEYYKSLGCDVDRSGSSWTHDLVISKSDLIQRIEEKFRFDVSYPDIIVELIQSAEVGELGWFYHIEVDYLVYVFCRDGIPERAYRIKWRSFKDWFIVWLSKGKLRKAPVSSKGNGVTVNIAVPITMIPEECYSYREF